MLSIGNEQHESHSPAHVSAYVELVEVVMHTVESSHKYMCIYIYIYILAGHKISRMILVKAKRARQEIPVALFTTSAPG
jgi:hypothetical protein